MQRLSIKLTGLVIALAVAVFAGCTLFGNQGATRSDQSAASHNATQSKTDTRVLRGTVVKKDLEGGFFAIEGDDGKTYDPLNLPDAFKRNGTRVKATIRTRDDVGSIHMVGEIIEIVDIVEQ